MRRAAKRALVLALAVVVGAAVVRAATKLPAPEKFTLKNGITVYYLKNADLPLVSFRMWIRGAGTANEPAALDGAASLTADLLMKGTAKMDADAVAEAVEYMGVRLDIAAGDEYASVSGESLAEHFPRVMEIAADCLMNPAFKEDEFTKERKTRLDNIKAVKDNPGAAIRSYFVKAYYGTHPLGHLANGTETALAKIALADIKSYYHKTYRPERGIAAVVGSMEKAALLDLLNATIGQWKAAGAASPVAMLPALPKHAGKRLILVDKPDATQAYWILGASGYPLGDKITPQASVMNTLFGGRFTSWLSTELRIKRGLTYGASSSFQTWKAGGIFVANSYTKNDKIGEMLDIVFELLGKAKKEGFAAEEIESARNYMLGQFPPTLETNSSKATAYVRLVFHNLGFDYYDKYLAGIQAVTGQLAKDAAAALLPESNFILVVVGKAADIKQQLEKYGTWTEKKITDPDY
jgi:zinc protease